MKITLDSQTAIVRRYDKLKSDRGNWLTQWEQLARLYFPAERDLNYYLYPQSAKGVEQQSQIYDSTGTHNVDLYLSSAQNYMINPATQYFELTTRDFDLDDNEAVRDYLYKTARKIQSLMTSANFQVEANPYLRGLIVFGTAIMQVFEDEEEIIRFKTLQSNQCVIDVNGKGQVDTLFIPFKMTGRNILNEFEKNLDEELINKFKHTLGEEYNLLQAILPRDNRDVTKLDALNKPWASYVFFLDKKVCIHESGYDYQPFACSRAEVYNSEIYGRSLAMKTLPDVKMLQQIKKETIKAVHKVNDPPLLMPDDSFTIPVTNPNAVIPFRAGSDKPTPLISGAQPHVGLDFIKYVAEEVGSGFFTDILQTGMGSKGKTPISATEVNSLEAQRMRVQSQFIPRQELEWLAPIVTSVFNIANKKGLMGPPPDILAGKQLSVKFSSRIVREQKMIESQSIDAFIGSACQIAGVRPEILDNIDFDAYIAYKAKAMGIPTDLMVDSEQVGEIRQQRAQQQQAMQNQQSDLNQAETIKTLAAAGGGM